MRPLRERLAHTTIVCLVVALSASSIADEHEQASTRLYVLDCGYMDMSGWQGFQAFYGFPESDVAIPAQANPCFLIVNQGQSLLWDAGLSDATPSTPVMTEYGVRFSLKSKLAEQLQDLNYPPQKIDYLALSHLHFDHIGNLPYFVNVKTLIQRDEWNAAKDAGPNDIGYNQRSYSPLEDFTKLILLDGDLDVFGDGKVRVFKTPGHTPGHQSLIVHLDQHGPIVISGDIIHFTEELATLSEASDTAAPGEPVSALAKLISRAQEIGGELWVQHDPVQDKARKYAPEYYE